MSANYGQVRRAPTGFAHAIRIQQPHEEHWEVIDLYGSTTSFDKLLADIEVEHWPIVYTPEPDDVWEEKHGGNDKDFAT